MPPEKPKESTPSKLIVNGFKRNTQQTSQSHQEHTSTIQSSQTNTTKQFWTDDRVQQWKEIRQKTTKYAGHIDTAIKSSGLQQKVWKLLKTTLTILLVIGILTLTYPFWIPVLIILVIYAIVTGGKGGSINGGGGGGGINMQ